MKTAVAETSLLVQDSNRRSGRAQRQEDKVYAKLRQYRRGLTNAELGRILSLPASTIAARINRLKKLGLVAVKTRRPCRHTGNTAQVHWVPQP